MKEETKLELLKIAASLTTATIQAKDAILGESDSGLSVDTSKVFVRAVSLAAAQFEALGDTTDQG